MLGMVKRFNFSESFAILFVFGMTVLSPLKDANASDKLDWDTDGVAFLAMYANNVSIRVNDGVKDGCMPNPARVERSAELQLRRNNFEISDGAAWVVKIDAGGYEVTSKGGDSLGCAVTLRIELLSIIKGLPVQLYPGTPSDLHGLFTTNFLLGAQLLVGDKGSMQSRIEKEVEDAVDEMLLRKLRAKEALNKNFSAELNRLPE